MDQLTTAMLAQGGAVATSPPETSAPAARAGGRPWLKAVLQLIRRCHLYAGLLLLPWVILYGLTAFLFNHPGAFSDQPTLSFGKDELRGTPMETPPAPGATAEQVVAALQARASSGTTYRLVEPEKARYTRELAFAVVKTDTTETSVLLDVNGNGGTIRQRPVTPPKPEEKAPFAIRGKEGAAPGGRTRPGGPPSGGRGGEGLKLDAPLHERVKETVTLVLAQHDLDAAEVTVTSVPDLAFQMHDGDKVWRVTYNSQTGTVTGKSDESEPEPLSTRRFLTRLHTAHGYPLETNARWSWALLVDAMAAIMLFWGLSGLVMWWQIKSTRWYGAAVLIVSAVAATWLGLGMHEAISAVGR